jgi:hypothetical protein
MPAACIRQGAWSGQMTVISRFQHKMIRSLAERIKYHAFLNVDIDAAN